MRREKNSGRRKCIESTLISQFSAINLRSGPHISPIIAKAIVTQCGIHDNREKKQKKKKRKRKQNYSKRDNFKSNNVIGFNKNKKYSDNVNLLTAFLKKSQGRCFL